MKTFFYSGFLNRTIWLFLSLAILTISIQAQNDTCLLFDGGDQLSTFEPQDPNQQTRRTAVFNEIGAGDFTIEFNINSDGPGNQVEAVISNRASSASSDGFMVFFHPPRDGENYKRISIRINNFNFFLTANGTFNGDIQDGTCHHIAVVRSGLTLTFYVDGIEIGSIDSSLIAGDISTTMNTLIGYDAFDETGFNGVISDMRIWNVVRSAANINQFKDSYLTGSETGLVANWRLDNLGSGLQDSSPNDNDIFKANDVSTHPETINDCCSISDNVCITNTSNEPSHPDIAGLQALYNATDGDNWTNTTAGIDPWFEDCDPCGLEDGTPWFRLRCLSGNNRVTWIGLGFNNLIGQIPEEIQGLDELSFLYLVGNDLSGEIPVFFGDMPSFRYINLASTKLSGTIPESICNITELEYFNVEINQLTGEIPACVADLHQLEHFNVRNNMLSGSLPLFDGDQQNLDWLTFFNNNFTGEIPPGYGELSPTVFGLQNNNLIGDYPIELTSWCSLGYMNNQISDGNALNQPWEEFCNPDICQDRLEINDRIIPERIYHTDQYIKSNGVVDINTTVEFKSNEILLNPNFEVLESAIFEAVIESCDCIANTCPSSKNAPSFLASPPDLSIIADSNCEGLISVTLQVDYCFTSNLSVRFDVAGPNVADVNLTIVKSTTIGSIVEYTLAGTMPLGLHNIKLLAEDANCNLSDTESFDVKVDSLASPTTFECKKVVKPIDNTGTVTFNANEIVCVTDGSSCSGFNPTMIASFSNDPTDNTRTFTCADINPGNSVGTDMQLTMFIYDVSDVDNDGVLDTVFREPCFVIQTITDQNGVCP